MNRRAFISAFSTAATAIAFDPERALWTPGKKLISIPRLVEFEDYKTWLYRTVLEDCEVILRGGYEPYFLTPYRERYAAALTSPAAIAPSHPAVRS